MGWHGPGYRGIAAATLTLGIAGAAAADPWQALDGAGITAALTGTRLVYADAWQTFSESGRTLYNAGRDSWGYWRVEGDRYCSQWPPAGDWACYSMSRDSATGNLRFEAADGSATVGRIAE